MALASLSHPAQPERVEKYSAQNCMAHRLFRLHADADIKRAAKFATAIEAGPEAQDAGWKVWVDKRPDRQHRLHPGTSWHDQLTAAIVKESTLFGLLGTREDAQNIEPLRTPITLGLAKKTSRCNGK